MFVVVVVAAVVVYPLGSIHVLGALHHHLEIFVDFVVFGFGARRQRVMPSSRLDAHLGLPV